MESKEIKAGDVVCLKHKEDRTLLMTIGQVKDGIATCYWSHSGEVKQADIPIVVLILM